MIKENYFISDYIAMTSGSHNGFLKRILQVSEIMNLLAEDDEDAILKGMEGSLSITIKQLATATGGDPTNCTMGFDLVLVMYTTAQHQGAQDYDTIVPGDPVMTSLDGMDHCAPLSQILIDAFGRNCRFVKLTPKTIFGKFQGATSILDVATNVGSAFINFARNITKKEENLFRDNEIDTGEILPQNDINFSIFLIGRTGSAKTISGENIVVSWNGSFVPRIEIRQTPQENNFQGFI